MIVGVHCDRFIRRQLGQDLASFCNRSRLIISVMILLQGSKPALPNKESTDLCTPIGGLWQPPYTYENALAMINNRC